MSGEGILASRAPRKGYSARFAAGRKAEREDVLALLRRRRENAAIVARQRPSMDDYADDRRRQLEIIIDEIEQELHLGDAEVAAAVGAE